MRLLWIYFYTFSSRHETSVIMQRDFQKEEMVGAKTLKRKHVDLCAWNGSLMRKRTFTPIPLTIWSCLSLYWPSFPMSTSWWILILRVRKGSQSPHLELSLTHGPWKHFVLSYSLRHPWASFLIIHQSKGPSALCSVCSMDEIKACVIWLHSSFPFFTSVLPLWTAHGA